jgi:sulfur carrier protein
MMITIKLNGETRQIKNALTISSLIDELGLTGKRIAFERNGDIVPRSQFATQILQEGDAVEIVVAVGGG